MTKAICELLLNDHSRKGHFDGRTARLPTVIVRPGKPNAAASSWASGMFREPLNGVPCALPIRRDQCHPMTGYRTVIDFAHRLARGPESALSDDRAYVLPAHTVTPTLAEKVLREIAIERRLILGPIVDAFDARIQGIVSNWPVSVDGSALSPSGSLRRHRSRPSSSTTSLTSPRVPPDPRATYPPTHRADALLPPSPIPTGFPPCSTLNPPRFPPYLELLPHWRARPGRPPRPLPISSRSTSSTRSFGSPSVAPSRASNSMRRPSP